MDANMIMEKIADDLGHLERFRANAASAGETGSDEDDAAQMETR